MEERLGRESSAATGGQASATRMEAVEGQRQAPRGNDSPTEVDWEERDSREASHPQRERETTDAPTPPGQDAQPLVAHPPGTVAGPAAGRAALPRVSIRDGQPVPLDFSTTAARTTYRGRFANTLRTAPETRHRPTPAHVLGLLAQLRTGLLAPEGAAIIRPSLLRAPAVPPRPTPPPTTTTGAMAHGARPPRANTANAGASPTGMREDAPQAAAAAAPPAHPRPWTALTERPEARLAADGTAPEGTTAATEHDMWLGPQLNEMMLMRAGEALDLEGAPTTDSDDDDDDEEEEEENDEETAGHDVAGVSDEALLDAADDGTDDVDDDPLDIYPHDVRESTLGMDIQGVPWGRIPFHREAYRAQRVREYNNYTNVADSGVARLADASRPLLQPISVVGGREVDDSLHDARGAWDGRWHGKWWRTAPADAVSADMQRGKYTPVRALPGARSVPPHAHRQRPYYFIESNTRRVRPSVVHFQLRHLLRATDEDTVYLVQNNCLVRYHAPTKHLRCLLNLSGETLIEEPGGISEHAWTVSGGRTVDRAGSRAARRQRRFQLRYFGNTDGNHTRMTGTGRLQTSPSAPAPDCTSRATRRQVPPHHGHGRRVQVSTMATDGYVAVAGGFFGEIVGVDCRSERVLFDVRVTPDLDNAITNSIELFGGCGGCAAGMSGPARYMATANNDCRVRIYDLERLALDATTATELSGVSSTVPSAPSRSASAPAPLSSLVFPWPVNHTSVRPSAISSSSSSSRADDITANTLLAVAGDETNVFLVPCNAPRDMQVLRGHRDYTFATAWHPNGLYLATGNQDCTCRLWDVRRLDRPLLARTLAARMGAVRSVHFSGDGRFLCAAEAADFVHLIDTVSAPYGAGDPSRLLGDVEVGGVDGYAHETVLDVFGEVAGVSFTPGDGERLFVSVTDRTYGCLLQLRRSRHAGGAWLPGVAVA